jgi:hypothetical protein
LQPTQPVGSLEDSSSVPAAASAGASFTAAAAAAAGVGIGSPGQQLLLCHGSKLRSSYASVLGRCRCQ